MSVQADHFKEEANKDGLTGLYNRMAFDAMIANAVESFNEGGDTFSIVMFDKFKIDDPVGAISVHGVVGLWGLLAVPLTNDGGSFMGQIIGALVIFGWVFVTSLAV